MSAPRIAVVSWSRSDLPGGVFQACRVRGWGLYRVEREGTFGGRKFREGEFIACSENADARRGGILAPKGRGRVRFGTEHGGRLIGDSGEVCSSERWMVCGGIEAVIRPLAIGEQRSEIPGVALPTPRGWTTEAWSNSPVASLRGKRLSRKSLRAQLSLFGGELRKAA